MRLRTHQTITSIAATPTFYRKSRKAQLGARVLLRMGCGSDGASRSARQHGSGCRTDGLACNAWPVMVSLRRRTGGSCCGALRSEAPSSAATLLETLRGAGQAPLLKRICAGQPTQPVSVDASRRTSCGTRTP
jgi:hypothetical protein